MARNVEIKATIPDLKAIRRKAASLTSIPSEILEQTDTFFMVPAGRLKLREFSGGSGELIAYERPDRPAPRESVYTRHECADARTLLEALRMVLPIRGVVVKRRQVFVIGRTRIHLDEVDGLGSFVELEVVLRDGEALEIGEREARHLMGALGIPKAALIAQAYIDLIERLPARDTASTAGPAV